MTPFRPHPLLSGGHRQTLLGYWLRRRLRWTAPSEDVIVRVDDEVSLLLRASWQRAATERPTLLLVHGLAGCDRASYAMALGGLARQAGWNVVRMNMRGAGDGERLCARLYNASLDGDLVSVLHALAARTRYVALAGFSLGGNLVLLALGRCAERIPAGVFAAAAVSPPLDVSACADALARWTNRLYQLHYMRHLRAAYRVRQTALPQLYERGRERGLRTIRQFDEAITAPYGGFQGADDYYARSSAGPWLTHIDRPTLILAAEDDPLVPVQTVTRWALPMSGVVQREITRTGGHLGFLARTGADGGFWAAERVMEFLDQAWAAVGSTRSRDAAQAPASSTPLDDADPAA